MLIHFIYSQNFNISIIKRQFLGPPAARIPSMRVVFASKFRVPEFSISPKKLTLINFGEREVDDIDRISLSKFLTLLISTISPSNKKGF